MTSTYLSPSAIFKQFDISYTALRTWARKEQVRVITTPGGQRKYHYEDLCGLLGVKGPDASPQKKRIIYARVSSAKQAPDLQRQIAHLRECYPGHTDVLSDIASGINWSRPGLHKLLDDAREGLLAEVAISHRDRLCRFGFELIERILDKEGVKLLVLGEGDEAGDEAELQQDLLSIVTVFVARANGRRGGAGAKRAREGRTNEDGKASESQKRARGEIGSKSGRDENGGLGADPEHRDRGEAVRCA